MNYEFHPNAEAELLESVGFYESKVRGLGSAFINELEAVLNLACESPIQRKLSELQISGVYLCIDFPLLSFTEKQTQSFKYWLLLMIVEDHSTGYIGFRLLSKLSEPA